MESLPIILACLTPALLIGILIFYHAYTDRQKHKKNRIEMEKQKAAMEAWRNNLASIRPGMTQEKVFSLIGNNCTRSFLQNGTEICEWQIKENGSAVIMGSTTIATVQQSNGNEFSFKVTFKDNVAIEVVSGNRMV